MRAPVLPLLVLLFALGVRAQGAPDLVVEEDVPVEGEFFEVPFEVPVGTVELQIAHRALDDGDILDFGVMSPEGFRGYGGGNTEDAIVGQAASSRSYLPGPLSAGPWSLYVGKAKVNSAAPRYRVEISFRTEATLPPAADRAPWVDTPLATEARFYAGDLHVHSADSGDARPPLAEIADYARGRGLDFVVVSDHNTHAQVERIGAAQPEHPELLFVPGVEFTTYAGHGLGFGATQFVDHRIGWQGRTLQEALDELSAQAALFSINHPALNLGDACIGCAWEHETPPIGSLHGVEIETGGWRQAGRLFAFDAIALWEQLQDEGHHLAPLGGSDDHQAGQGNSSPIGDPTTMIFAEGLSVAALRQGILDSRTVVKLQGPDDPMIVLDTDVPRLGDTVAAPTVTFTATVTGGVGAWFRFVKGGLGVEQPVEIREDPQAFTLTLTPGGGPGDRVRAEVQVDEGGELVPRTLTGYVWMTPAAPGSCACSSSAGADSVGPSMARAAAGAGPGLLAGALAMGIAISARRRRAGPPSR